MDLETLLGELREPQPDPATESDGVHPACFSIEAGHHATSTAVHTNPLSQCRHSRNFCPILDTVVSNTKNFSTFFVPV